MADMLHHTAAVTRGARRALVVGDMPFLSYPTPDAAVTNAGRFLAEAGAQAVKIEGGVRSARTIEALVKAGIPVMGHIGWTPQAANQGGKTRVQGKNRDQARALLSDAFAVQEAGAFAVVLELVPGTAGGRHHRATAHPHHRHRRRRRLLRAGPGHHGPAGSRFVAPQARQGLRRPAEASSWARSGRTPRTSVDGSFPGSEQTVRMDDDVLADTLGEGALDRAAGSDLVSIPLDRDL